MNEWTFRRVAWTTLVFVMVAAGFWLLYRFYAVLFILFIAIAFGTAVRPMVDWLSRRRVPRLAAVESHLLSILFLIIGFGLLLFPINCRAKRQDYQLRGGLLSNIAGMDGQ